MNTRERVDNLLHFRPVDHLPAIHFGYWRELLLEWADQGKISRELAVSVCDSNDADFELDRIIGWDCNWSHTKGANIRLTPSFEEKVLEVLPDGSQRVQTKNGVIEKIKPGIVSDIMIDNAINAFKYAGVAEDDIAVAKTLEEANALMEQGKL